MNIGTIAERFIRAAEIERNLKEHVGPAALRGQQLPYIHSYEDKLNWRKEPGDKLMRGEDPLTEERKAFWERMGFQPSASELSEMDILFAWLVALDNECERRALLAWARSKVGGKSFRRWCFTVENIHPETGRRRKDRALAKIQGHLSRSVSQHDENREIRVLQPEAEIGDVSDTIAEDVGKRDGLSNWAADDAFSKVFNIGPNTFSWAAKRNQRRRQKEAQRRKQDERKAA